MEPERTNPANKNQVSKVQVVRGRRTNSRNTSNSPQTTWQYSGTPNRQVSVGELREARSKVEKAKKLASGRFGFYLFFWAVVFIYLWGQLPFALISLMSVFIADPNADLTSKVANYFLDGGTLMWIAVAIAAAVGGFNMAFSTVTMGGISAVRKSTGLILFIFCLALSIAPFINVLPWVLVWVGYLFIRQVKDLLS